MVLETIVVGGVILYALKSDALGKITNALSDFQKGYKDEQLTQHEQAVMSEAQAAYDYVFRDILQKATLEDLPLVTEIFSKYSPRISD